MTAMPNIESLIAAIVRDPRLHARFINTFSFLEYVGFRKIVKSQRAETFTADVLNHAVEEGRHALRLKKLAIGMGGPAFDSYGPEVLLCGEEAEAYMQALDHQCEAQFTDRPDVERVKLTYLYVTWLIERRALAVYETYKQAVAGSEIVARIDGLLAEEVGHLRLVEGEIALADPQHVARAPAVMALEAELYTTFLASLAGTLAAETSLS